jgi:hypothetical protein
MFGKHGTKWQIGLAVVGLAIVAAVLIGPRGRGTTPLVAAPAADVASSHQSVQAILQPQPAQQQQSSDQPSGGQASAGSGGSSSTGSDGSGQPATSTSSAAKATGSAALPAVPAVGTVTKTLFSDNFASDPLGLGLPTGWLLADPAGSQSQSGGGLLGGLPVVGGLLGGLTGGGGSSSTGSLLPSVVNDGTHVLDHSAGTWSHLAAGPMTVDSTSSANVKMLGQSTGFVGVAGRFQDVNNSVMCGVNTNGGSTVLQLWQIVAGQAQMLASSPVSAAMGVFHTISMGMQGSQMSCSIDGLSMIHATGTLTSPGRIGLVALGDMTSEFSNVLSTSLS